MLDFMPIAFTEWQKRFIGISNTCRAVRLDLVSDCQVKAHVHEGVSLP